MALRFERVRMPGDRGRLVGFLTNDEWPFHGRRQISAESDDAIDFSSADVENWIVDDCTVGLLRVFDLSDVGLGAPQFDLRIASSQRGRGYGSSATAWVVGHLFDSYPKLHRIEAKLLRIPAGRQELELERLVILVGPEIQRSAIGPQASTQEVDESSMLNLYRRAVAARRTYFTDDFDVEIVDLGPDTLCFRRGSGARCVVNMGSEPIPLPDGASGSATRRTSVIPTGSGVTRCRLQAVRSFVPRAR